MNSLIDLGIFCIALSYYTIDSTICLCLGGARVDIEEQMFFFRRHVCGCCSRQDTGQVCRGARGTSDSPLPIAVSLSQGLPPSEQPHFGLDGDFEQLPGSWRRDNRTFNCDVPKQGVNWRFSHFEYFASTGGRQGGRKRDSVYPNTVLIKVQ